MPQNKIEIIEIKIPLDQIQDTINIKLSDSAKVKLNELVNEQKIIAKAILGKKKQNTQDLENIKRVFSILKESLVRAKTDKCTPEPISIAKLKELYGSDITTNSLLSKIRNYIQRNYNNNIILTKHTKNGKSAYALAQYGELDFH